MCLSIQPKKLEHYKDTSTNHVLCQYSTQLGDNLQLFDYLKCIFKTAGRILTDQTAKLLTIMYWPQNDNYSGGELILKLIYNIQNIYGGRGNFVMKSFGC